MMSSESHEILHDQETHPIDHRGTYWKICITLVILTVLEVGLYWMETQHMVSDWLAATLILILSALKFALVVMFYMHLKYDSKVFTGIFLFPFALGALVIFALFVLYKILPVGGY
jgi:cytochrome c oxidase subunit IV